MPTLFRLRELLEEKGVSQRRLAAESGVSPTTINRMCANLTAQVSLATLDAIAGVLEIEPGELFERQTKGRGK